MADFSRSEVCMALNDPQLWGVSTITFQTSYMKDLFN